VITVPEFYYWPGNVWNAPEIAVGEGDRFIVIATHNRVRRSPLTKDYLDNAENGWIRLVPETSTND
jgi:hypothetical protein